MHLSTVQLARGALMCAMLAPQTMPKRAREAPVARPTELASHNFGKNATKAQRLPKLTALVNCLCSKMLSAHRSVDGASGLITDIDVLQAHHKQLVAASVPLRPQKRTDKLCYRDYCGPRLEDHFIHNFIRADISLFAPLVPLFVHWTQLEYAAGPRPMAKALQILGSLLRKDVLYFTVTSAHLPGSTDALLPHARHLLIASSKGIDRAHIVMPHLYTYQPRGFDERGGAIWQSRDRASQPQETSRISMPHLPRRPRSARPRRQATHPTSSIATPLWSRSGSSRPGSFRAGINIGSSHASSRATQSPRASSWASWSGRRLAGTLGNVGTAGRVGEAGEAPRDAPTRGDYESARAWAFQNYDSYQQANASGMQTKRCGSEKRAPIAYTPLVFVGSTTTLRWRKWMDAALRKASNLLQRASSSTPSHGAVYQHVFLPTCQMCPDSSVPQQSSPCWRVHMLAARLNICPVGSAPVSYRLFEALQQGSVPVVVHDNRGIHLPYAGTRADVSGGSLGWVVHCAQLTKLVTSTLAGVSDAEVKRRRVRILALRQSHFTPAGVVDQLRRWLAAPHEPAASDVRCRPCDEARRGLRSARVPQDGGFAESRKDSRRSHGCPSLPTRSQHSQAFG